MHESRGLVDVYKRQVDDDPMRFIVPFIRGYHERNPLSETELNLLYDLIRTRLMMTLIILYWRISARSPGDPYREKTLMGEATAFGFLRSLSNIGPTVFRNSLTT